MSSAENHACAGVYNVIIIGDMSIVLEWHTVSVEQKDMMRAKGVVS
jgi:hypothetical protein